MRTPEEKDAYEKEWRAKNPERMRLLHRRWRQENPDKVRQHKTTYYSRNREKSLAYTREWRRAHPERVAELVRLSRARDPFRAHARKLLTSAKYRAKKTYVPFSLTLEDMYEMLKPRVCSVSGMPLDFTVNAGYRANSPSLDRIQMDKGYVRENVRITTYMVNLARNRFSDDDLYAMCLAIAGRLNRA